MGDRSKIEWTEATWTPIRARWIALTDDGSGVERVGWHCEHVSEGCRNCYAEGINRRLGTGLDFKPGNLFRQERAGYQNGEVRLFLDEKMLLAPLRWRCPRKIFVCSMTDLFADFVPDEWIDQIFAVMALCPQHTFQVLTKRPARMRAWVSQERARTAPVECIAELYTEHPEIAGPFPFTAERAIAIGRAGWPLPNVWLGTSCEDQATADARVPDLLATPAAIRFVSAEPLLRPIDFLRISGGGAFRQATSLIGALTNTGWHQIGLNWIIVGGESGPRARPMHPRWATDIRDQCAAAGVAFHFKQWGEWAPEKHGTGRGHATIWPDGHLQVEGEPGDGGANVHGGLGWGVSRVGKARAGRLLDGRTHDEMPKVQHG